MRRVVLLLLMLGGCADVGQTMAQKEARDIQQAVKYAVSQTEECVANLMQSPVYREVSDRFTIAMPGPEILANTNRPTETDVPALMEIHKSLTDCRTKELMNLNKAHSGYVAVVVRTFTEADVDFGKLTRREISWGQYAELMQARRQRHRARWNDIVQAVNTDLKSQHASEIRERQRAMQALAAWTETQRVSLPVYTQCMYVVAGITCTSF